MSLAAVAARRGLVDLAAALATAFIGTLAAVATVLGGCVPAHALPPSAATAIAAAATPASGPPAPQRPARPPVPR